MQIFNVSLLVIGVVSTAYSFFLYTSGNKGWFFSPIGQLLLSLSGAVGLFYAWYLVLAFWPDIPLRREIRAILFLITTGTLVWRAVILTKLRIIAKKDGTNEFN